MEDGRRGPGRLTGLGRWVIRRVVGPLVRAAFRPRLEGVARLPEDRPYMLVANHSAGLGLAELLSFAWLYWRHVGEGRPMAGFAHELGFRIKPVAAAHAHFGTVPSTYEAAYGALAEGVSLLVFPGGDYETLRPIWQARRVDLGGRKGFLRIAREAQVPIVPMGISGSHYTAPMLWRAPWLAKALVLPHLVGQKRWGVSLLGVLGAAWVLRAGRLPLWLRIVLAMLWISSPLSFFPIIPATIRFRIGAPLEPAALFPHNASGQPDDAELAAALEVVTAALQRLVLERS